MSFHPTAQIKLFCRLKFQRSQATEHQLEPKSPSTLKKRARLTFNTGVLFDKPLKILQAIDDDLRDRGEVLALDLLLLFLGQGRQVPQLVERHRLDEDFRTQDGLRIVEYSREEKGSSRKCWHSSRRMKWR